MSNYLRINLREGMKRIADENPGINFGVSSPGMEAAERKLGDAYARWFQSFNTPTAEVVRCFREWEAELKKANRYQMSLV